MKEIKYCHEEITMGVEIPVTVCETQKEMVKIISEYRKEYKWEMADEYTVIWVIYKDGSTFYHAFNDGEEEGKFKRTGIERAVISTSWESIVFGDFSIIDNGSISIDESDIKEYGVYAGQYDVKEEPEAAETVEETIVTVNQTEVITMMYITSKVTGEKKATITMATEKRLQELMNREHQSNEAKFLVWALEEYKCECGCGGASIKEIRKYAEQEDWLRDEFCFDTEGYMEDTARAMNNRFHDYMAYWCRLCHSSLSIKSFNKLVKAVYDMTDEYGYVIYPEEVEEEPEATTETAESVEETTVSETVEETAEQETELNAEVTQVEAEQTENNAESISETHDSKDVKIDISKTDELSVTTKTLMAFSFVASEYLKQIGYIDTS